MTEKRFEDIELLIFDGYIQDNYYDEKISNPTKIIKTLNELHEENEEMDKENDQLHNEIRELSLIGDKQARFILMKGYTFKEFLEFLKQEKCFDFTKKPENTKRFENSGRTIIDNQSKQHYIMTMDWEVSLIVKLLNKFYEEKEQLTKENKELQFQCNMLREQSNEFHRGARENANRVGQLKKENKELKQLIDLFAQDICDLTEILSKNQLDYKLHSDVENFIIKWGVRIE